MVTALKITSYLLFTVTNIIASLYFSNSISNIELSQLFLLQSGILSIQAFNIFVIALFYKSFKNKLPLSFLAYLLLFIVFDVIALILIFNILLKSKIYVVMAIIAILAAIRHSLFINIVNFDLIYEFLEQRIIKNDSYFTILGINTLLVMYFNHNLNSYDVNLKLIEDYMFGIIALHVVITALLIFKDKLNKQLKLSTRTINEIIVYLTVVLVAIIMQEWYLSFTIIPQLLDTDKTKAIILLLLLAIRIVKFVKQFKFNKQKVF